MSEAARDPRTEPKVVRRFAIERPYACPFCGAWLLPEDLSTCRKCGAAKTGNRTWTKTLETEEDHAAD